MTELLAKMGFTVVSAGEVNDYLGKIKAQETKPRICIVDIDDPDINSFVLARNIKAIYPDTIVLAYSVYENNELNLERLHDYGVDVFLEKSFPPEKIRMLIYSADAALNRLLLN